MPNFAPIVVFAYKRVKHLARTLDALERCPEFASSSVTIYSDGAKSDADRADVAAVRSLLANRRRPNMTIIEAPFNRGLANSIIAGVTEQCNRSGRVIVLEDDLLLSPIGLTWFNLCLNRFQDDEKVFQISAHQFPVHALARRQTGMFLSLNTSWGWATWKRAWDRFDCSASGWERLRDNASLRRRFDLNDAYPYARMMEEQMAGKIDSWAIRWWWSVFCAGGLGLFPPQSLITDIGNDGTATHPRSRMHRLVSARPKTADIRLPTLPNIVAVDQHAQRSVENYLRRHTQWARLKRALRCLRD